MGTIKGNATQTKRGNTMFKIQEITGHLPEKGYSVEGGFATLEDALNHAEDKQRYHDSTLSVTTPSGAVWYNKTRNSDGWKKLD